MPTTVHFLPRVLIHVFASVCVCFIFSVHVSEHSCASACQPVFMFLSSHVSICASVSSQRACVLYMVYYVRARAELVLRRQEARRKDNSGRLWFQRITWCLRNDADPGRILNSKRRNPSVGRRHDFTGDSLDQESRSYRIGCSCFIAQGYWVPSYEINCQLSGLIS